MSEPKGGGGPEPQVSASDIPTRSTLASTKPNAPSFSTQELDYLIYKHFIDAGLPHAAWTFAQDSKILDANTTAFPPIPQGALCNVVQKGMAMVGLEMELAKKDGETTPKTLGLLELLSPELRGMNPASRQALLTPAELRERQWRAQQERTFNERLQEEQRREKEVLMEAVRSERSQPVNPPTRTASTVIPGFNVAPFPLLPNPFAFQPVSNHLPVQPSTSFTLFNQSTSSVPPSLHNLAGTIPTVSNIPFPLPLINTDVLRALQTLQSLTPTPPPSVSTPVVNLAVPGALSSAEPKLDGGSIRTERRSAALFTSVSVTPAFTPSLSPAEEQKSDASTTVIPVEEEEEEVQSIAAEVAKLRAELQRQEAEHEAERLANLRRLREAEEARVRAEEELRMKEEAKSDRFVSPTKVMLPAKLVKYDEPPPSERIFTPSPNSSVSNSPKPTGSEFSEELNMPTKLMSPRFHLGDAALEEETEEADEDSHSLSQKKICPTTAEQLKKKGGKPFKKNETEKFLPEERKKATPVPEVKEPEKLPIPPPTSPKETAATETASTAATAKSRARPTKAVVPLPRVESPFREKEKPAAFTGVLSITSSRRSKISQFDSFLSAEYELRMTRDKMMMLSKHDKKKIPLSQWSPNPVYKEQLVTVDKDALARIWDLTGCEDYPPEQAEIFEDKSIEINQDDSDEPTDSPASKRKKKEPKEITCVAWHPEKPMFALAYYDGKIRTFKHDGTLHNVFESHSKKVTSVKWNKVGTHLLSVGADGIAMLWEPSEEVSSKAKPPIHKWQLHRGQANEVEWLGRTLFASCGNDRKIQICEESLSMPSRSLVGHEGAVESVRFDPESQRLASFDDKCIMIWKLDQNKPQHICDHKEVTTIKWSPVSLLASASRDSEIKIWTSDGTYICTLDRHTAAVTCFDFDKTGAFIATGSNDKSILIWDVESVEIRQSYNAVLSDGKICSLSFNTDSTKIAATTDEGELVVLDMRGLDSSKPLITGRGQRSTCRQRPNYNVSSRTFVTRGGATK